MAIWLVWREEIVSSFWMMRSAWREGMEDEDQEWSMSVPVSRRGILYRLLCQ